MKITTVLLLVTIMQVSAAGYAQQLTLKDKKISIARVFLEINKQTGYDVLYFPKSVNTSKTINADFKDTPLDQVLKVCLEGQPLTYTIDEKTIVIKEAPNRITTTSTVETRLIASLQETISGRVVDSIGHPLEKATVKIKGTNRATFTDREGRFTLRAVEEGAILEISYLGYLPREIPAFADLESIVLQISQSALDLVEVNVSTGYQTIAKERATGSFVLIDSALLNRRVGTNVLDRLDGITSGLIFNRNLPGQANNSDISIRGRSTIFANPDPLIILDNFPYEGNLDNINPNDIESITILKDAAAASIWGVRAGNGVIVISTKKGQKDTPPQVSFNSNVTIGDKPDLYYSPQLTSAQFIEVEEFLFNRGRYNSTINNGYAALTPAVEVFLKRRNSEISAADSATMIDQLKQYDIRRDMGEYLYRNSVNQQYALNVRGGSQSNQYYLSAGYDKNLDNSQVNSFDRFTLNANNTYVFLKNKMTWTNGILFTNSKSVNNTSIYSTPFTPYDRLADEDGNSLPIYRFFRQSYLDIAGDGHLLDWRYFPLDDMEEGKRIANLTDYRLTTELHYKVFDALKVSAYYLYQRGGDRSQSQSGP